MVVNKWHAAQDECAGMQPLGSKAGEGSLDSLGCFSLEEICHTQLCPKPMETHSGNTSRISTKFENLRSSDLLDCEDFESVFRTAQVSVVPSVCFRWKCCFGERTIEKARYVTEDKGNTWQHIITLDTFSKYSMIQKHRHCDTWTYHLDQTNLYYSSLNSSYFC